MKTYLAALLLCATSLYADQYAEILADYPKGSHKQGEIEIATTSQQREEIEKSCQKRLVQKGATEKMAKEWTKSGIIAEDSYWIWVRDAVQFPSGALGTYNRLMAKTPASEGVVGVVVLPVLSNGKIAVNLNYRHATRSWEIELPRGGLKKGESTLEGAKRELEEETGCVATDTTFLGTLAPDSGVLGNLVSVYLGKVTEKKAADVEESEAILDILSFTKEELKQGLADGYLEVVIGGEKRKVPCRDGFLAYALLMSEVRKAH